MSEHTQNEEENVVWIETRPPEYEYRTVRMASGKTITTRVAIISDNDDFPKKHRMAKKRGPGRPKKKKPEQVDNIEGVDLDMPIE